LAARCVLARAGGCWRCRASLLPVGAETEFCRADCVLSDGLRAGFDPEADARRFFVSPAGVVVITPEML